MIAPDQNGKKTAPTRHKTGLILLNTMPFGNSTPFQKKDKP
jgi:hypothetical protein